MEENFNIENGLINGYDVVETRSFNNLQSIAASPSITGSVPGVSESQTTSLKFVHLFNLRMRAVD
jgi:hypothetical protein